ncbi:MAG: DUF2079 domain-containing protein [Gemmatimonadota bacterium]
MAEEDAPPDPPGGGNQPGGATARPGSPGGLGPGAARPPWHTAEFPVTTAGLPLRPVKPRAAPAQAPWDAAGLPAAPPATPAALPVRPLGSRGTPDHPPWDTAEFPLPVTGQPGPLRAQGTGPAAGPARQRAGWAAWLLALVAFAAYAAISVFRYLRLQPGSWDLGIYTEYVRQIAHLHMPVVPIRSPGFNLLGDHFQPIVALLAPFFRVFPSPLTLLIAQALLTAVSVVPVIRAARTLTGPGVSLAIGAAYAFSWGLQQMVNFDFHEIAFAVPLLAFSLSALVTGRLLAAALWALPLVLVKEDQGFTVAVIGLIVLGAALSVPGHGLRYRAGRAGRRRTWALAGTFLLVWGLAWSAAEILVIIPHFNVAHHYQYWQAGGVISLHGQHFSAAGALGQLRHASGVKLRTLLMIGLPVAFLALGSPLALAAAPNLLLRFLSTNSYYWGTDWHYNATLMPVVFLAAVDTLARVRGQAAEPSAAGDGLPAAGAGPGAPARRVPAARALAALWLARAAAAAMVGVAGWLAIRQPVGQLWQPQTYTISAHVRAEEAAMAKVPPGTTVEATLSMLAPLAARDDTSWVGTVGLHDPRYLVFDATNSGWSPLPVSPPLRFLEQRHPGAVYQQIFEASGVYVFRLMGPTGQ